VLVSTTVAVAVDTVELEYDLNPPETVAVTVAVDTETARVCVETTV